MNLCVYKNIVSTLKYCWSEVCSVIIASPPAFRWGVNIFGFRIKGGRQIFGFMGGNQSLHFKFFMGGAGGEFEVHLCIFLNLFSNFNFVYLLSL